MNRKMTDSHRFQPGFSKDAMRGRHFFTLRPDLNEAFLVECATERRDPTDLIRIILEDRYSKVETNYPKTVEVREDAKPTKRNVA